MAKRKKTTTLGIGVKTYVLAYGVNYTIQAKSEEDALRILEAYVESTNDVPVADLKATQEELDLVVEAEQAYVNVLQIL
jgi:hypothetical protein